MPPEWVDDQQPPRNQPKSDRTGPNRPAKRDTGGYSRDPNHHTTQRDPGDYRNGSARYQPLNSGTSHPRERYNGEQRSGSSHSDYLSNKRAPNWEAEACSQSKRPKREYAPTSSYRRGGSIEENRNEGVMGRQAAHFRGQQQRGRWGNGASHSSYPSNKRTANWGAEEFPQSKRSRIDYAPTFSYRRENIGESRNESFRGQQASYFPCQQQRGGRRNGASHPDRSYRSMQEAQQINLTNGECLGKSNFPAKNFAAIANGFSKNWAKSPYKEALLLIAQEISTQNRFTSYLNDPEAKDKAKSCALLANAFSKWDKDKNCQAAVVKIAQYIAAKVVLDKSFNSQDLANLGNAFSKSDKDKNCQAAVSKIAQRIAVEGVLDKTFNSQTLANLANAFSKRNDKEACTKAVSKIAQRIAVEGLLDQTFTSQHLANLANAFSKLDKDVNCQAALSKIAQRIAVEGLLDQTFTSQHLANLANAFSKWDKDKNCQEAVIKIAQRITVEGVLDQSFNSQTLANLANAFSKWDQEEACQDAVIKIAQYVTDKVVLDDKFKPQELANLANAFSKSDKDKNCQAAVVKIAQYIAHDKKV